MLLYYSYVTILTLVRVRTEQKGLYTVIVTNGDDSKEVTFNLEVQGERPSQETNDHSVQGVFVHFDIYLYIYPCQ